MTNARDTDLSLHEASDVLKRGGLIAYPTEAVYGLGCDPFNVDPITRLLQLKQRPISKGFLLIAANWEQVEPLVQPIPTQALARVRANWPGHITYVFPARPEVPHWLQGAHQSLAIRITEHPMAAKLCELFGKPIVSTSANLEGQPPIREQRALAMTFGDQLDYIVYGPVGHHSSPSQIRDAITDRVIRR